MSKILHVLCESRTNLLEDLLKVIESYHIWDLQASVLNSLASAEPFEDGIWNYSSSSSLTNLTTESKTEIESKFNLNERFIDTISEIYYYHFHIFMNGKPSDERWLTLLKLKNNNLFVLMSILRVYEAELCTKFENVVSYDLDPLIKLLDIKVDEFKKLTNANIPLSWVGDDTFHPSTFPTFAQAQDK